MLLIEIPGSPDGCFNNNLTLSGYGSAFDHTGLHLQNVTNSAVQQSSLSSFKNGLVYLNSGSGNATEVDHSRLISNKFGIVVAPEQNPHNAPSTANTSTNLINLDIECNKLWDNEVGIFGSGNLKNQGNSSDPAGNNFDDLILPINFLSRLIAIQGIAFK